MARMLCRTKGNANPKGKTRVYFTCHPADFERCFDKICEDIFKTHDCAIYYTEDMASTIPEHEFATDLGSNNLFVIPVTYNLLTQPNRTMNLDFPYAQSESIPVLPIMMEPDIDVYYAQPDKFGKLQYLNPYSTDLTEISYEEKLKKFLESVLVSDEVAKRIRAAFDAYIFLSYRKKDRRYANELMHLIHRNPECRDIAIWYDEFLTPGESFQDGIEKILHDSKLFALLVTPNLLEEPDGKPNFVMAEEYPAAKTAGIDILPVQMESVDQAKLGDKFQDIPDCVDVHNGVAFRDALLTALKRVAVTSNDADPEHNFLIGLAYLDGIDVEINRQRGIELITAAAEANLPEAMKKMVQICCSYGNREQEHQKACHFAQCLVDYYRRECGENHPSTLTWMNNTAVIYSDLGNYQKALEIQEDVYNIQRKTQGEEAEETLISLINLTSLYKKLGRLSDAQRLGEQAYEYCVKQFGEEYPLTLTSLDKLVSVYQKQGKKEIALELAEKAYDLYRKSLGEIAPETLSSLSSVADSYMYFGEYDKAIRLLQQICEQIRKVYGEESPYILSPMCSLAAACHMTRNYVKSKELNETAYSYSSKIYGEAHPTTLSILSNMAYLYEDFRKFDESLVLREKVFSERCGTLGDTHPETVKSLDALADAHFRLGDTRLALSYYDILHTIYCETLGEEHPDVLKVINKMSLLHLRLGESERALRLREKVYELCCKTLGEEHPDTLVALSMLAAYCDKAGDEQRKIELLEKSYALGCKVMGEDHLQTLITMKELAFAHSKAGNYSRAVELMEGEYNHSCKVRGEEHRDTLATLHSWGFICGRAGDHENAPALMEKAYELRRKVLGETHIDSLTSYTVLTGYYKTRENFQREAQLHAHMYSVRLQENGENHPMTRKTLADLTVAEEQWETQKETNRRKHVCQYCGGAFKGLIIKKCRSCGKPKDY